MAAQGPFSGPEKQPALPNQAPGQREQAGGLPPAGGDVLDSPHAGQRVVRGAFWRTLSFGLTNLVAVGSATLVLRYLGVTGLARYTTALSFATIVSGVFEAGLGNLGVREAAVYSGTARAEFLRNLFGVRLVVAAAGLAVASGAAAAVGYSPTLVGAVAIASAGIFLSTVQTHYATSLQIELRLLAFSLLELIRQVALTTFIGLAVIANGGLLAVLASAIPANLLVAGATAAVVRGRMPLRPVFRAAAWKRLVRRALPVALATTTGVVYSQISVLLMGAVSTQQQTGYFSASYRVFAVLAAIPGTLVATVLPLLSRAAKDHRERLQLSLARTFDTAALIGALMATLTVVGAPIAMTVLGGAQYSPAAGVLRIHGAALLPTALIAFAGYSLMSFGAYRKILGYNLVGLLISASLTAGLGAAAGARGGALGNLAGESVLALLYLSDVLRRGYKLHYTTAGRAVVVGGGAAAVGLLAPVPQLAALVIDAALAVGAVFALSLVPPEIIEALPLGHLKWRIARPSRQGTAER